jgi:hypothetical protein
MNIMDALTKGPDTGVCDNCGASLDRGGYYNPEYQLQGLPPGETINGRGFIFVCASGECLPDGGRYDHPHA